MSNVTRLRGFYGVVDLRPAHAQRSDSAEDGIAGALATRAEGRAQGGPEMADAFAQLDGARVVEHGMELARQLVSGGASAVQLRMKGAPVRLVLEVAAAIQPIVRAAGALFVVNDRLDVALAISADGVHLGQDDLPLQAARTAAARQVFIGISTHTPAQ